MVITNRQFAEMVSDDPYTIDRVEMLLDAYDRGDLLLTPRSTVKYKVVQELCILKGKKCDQMIVDDYVKKGEPE